MARRARSATSNETANSAVGTCLFPYFAKPRENEQDDGTIKLEYECLMVFDDPTGYEDISRLATRAASAVWGADREAWPDGWKNPFKKCSAKGKKQPDGTITLPPGFEHGKVYIKVKSMYQPVVVDKDVKTILNIAGDVYSGCKGLVTVNVYMYGGEGTRFTPGIGLGLRAFQKVADGVPVGGGRLDPNSVFKPYKKPGDPDRSASDLL